MPQYNPYNNTVWKHRECDMYTTDSEAEKLLWTIKWCRFAYNELLAMVKITAEKEHRKVGYSEMCKWITLLRDEYPELGEIYAQLLQQTARKLSRVMSEYKFAGILNIPEATESSFKSITYPQYGFKVYVRDSVPILYIGRIGEGILTSNNMDVEPIIQLIVESTDSATEFKIICVYKETNNG